MREQDTVPVTEKLPPKVRNRRVHFANERTYLAWIRTSIGIMAFGFVVEKFGLFVKQISYFLSRQGASEGRGVIHGVQPAPPSAGYSSLLGIFLVGLGASMAVLAFIRYKKVERQIDEDTYRTSVILDTLLAMSVLVVGIFLMLYLFHSI
jgi:inner membrane protein YidH